MATAEELLAMSAESSEEILIADLDTRVISIPASITILGVEADDDVKVLRFNMPQHYGEFDLSKFQITVNFENARRQGDFYPVKSENVEVTDGVMAFDWLVDRSAYMYPGDVKFNLCLKLFDETGTVIKELNFTPATLPVLEGLETTKEVVESNPSAFDAVLFRLYAVEAATGNGQNGYYSIVKVEENEETDTVNITVVGSDGTTTAVIRHGIDGEPGYTPQRGIDYYTEEDKTEIKNYIDEWAPRAITVTLKSSGWVSGQQTVTIIGLTDDSIVIPSADPSSNSNYSVYNESVIRGVGHSGANITFACETVPSVDVNVNLAIFYSLDQLPGYTVSQNGEGYVDVTKCGVANDGTDCSLVLQELVKNGGQFYFPDGIYQFYNVEIGKDTVFRLDPDAEFHSEKSTRMIKAFECSFSMHGGKITSGTHYPDRPSTPYNHESRLRIASEYYGIVVLYGCHDCVIDGVTVPYSSHSTVFMVYGDHSGEDGKDRSVNVAFGGIKRNPARSNNIRFLNCKFDNFLLAAIAIRYGNDNILVDGCTFTNSLRANKIDSSTGERVVVDYGYCICTGVGNTAWKDTDDTIADAYIGYTPTNGYVIRNCYVKNCEGTALDTHAASNVIYENNVLLDCDSYITAYWDYRRVWTAEDWSMENIIVRNNYCKNTKAFDYINNGYPHPPFMLYSQGSIGKMRNVIIENNHIETDFYYYNASEGTYSFIDTKYVYDVIIRNNTLISTAASSPRAIDISCCCNTVVDNISLKGSFTEAVYLPASICKVGAFDCRDATFDVAVLNMNQGYHSLVDTDSLVVMPAGIENVVSGWEWSLHKYGQLLQERDHYIPLDGTTRSKQTYYVPKNFHIGQTHAHTNTDSGTWGQSVVSYTGNHVIVGTCRFVPGCYTYYSNANYVVTRVDRVHEYSTSVDNNGTEVRTITTRFHYIMNKDIPSGTSGPIYSVLPHKNNYPALGT